MISITSSRSGQRSVALTEHKTYTPCVFCPCRCLVERPLSVLPKTMVLRDFWGAENIQSTLFWLVSIFVFDVCSLSLEKENEKQVSRKSKSNRALTGLDCLQNLLPARSHGEFHL